MTSLNLDDLSANNSDAIFIMRPHFRRSPV